MATTQANFRVDTMAKEQFEAIVNQLGMTPSTAYNLFINATIRRQGLPFDVVLDPLADSLVHENAAQEFDRRFALDNNLNTNWK